MSVLLLKTSLKEGMLTPAGLPPLPKSALLFAGWAPLVPQQGREGTAAGGRGGCLASQPSSPELGADGGPAHSAWFLPSARLWFLPVSFLQSGAHLKSAQNCPLFVSVCLRLHCGQFFLLGSDAFEEDREGFRLCSAVSWRPPYLPPSNFNLRK